MTEEKTILQQIIDFLNSTVEEVYEEDYRREKEYKKKKFTIIDGGKE